MAIKPIDMQVMLPKMTEIAVAQGSESQRQLAASQRSKDRSQSLAEASTREVHAKENVRRVSFPESDDNEKGRGRGKGARQGTYGRGGGRGGHGGGEGGPGRQSQPSIDIKL